MEILSVLGSVQRALLGRVTPNLRAVHINIDNEQIILSFYYDKSPSEEEIELSSLADTDFISDFPGPEFKTDCKVLVVPYPQMLPGAQFYAYQRFEPCFEEILLSDNVPNEETIRVFKETDDGKNLVRYKHADELIDKLGFK